MSDKPNSAEFVGRVAAIIIVLSLVGGGWNAVDKYLQRKTSHDKLTTVRYHGEWLLSECNSMNLHEEGRQRELLCIGGSFIDSSSMDFVKICNVSFSGDLIHCWLCHVIHDTATFSCDAKPVEPPPTEERQLTHDEVEAFRKRNECEQRFDDNKIYEIGGMSVMAACKQNPERKP